MNLKITKPSIILVLGMHRSGTSLIAQLASKWGAYMGDNLYGANEYNKDGYWEYVPLVEFNEKILRFIGRTWYFPPEKLNVDLLVDEFGNEAKQIVAKMDLSNSAWCWKDPRMVFLLPFWKKILENRNIVYVVSARNPLAIIQSLNKRDSMPFTIALSLWECTVNHIAFELDDEPNCFVIEYDKLLTKPKENCNTLFTFLNSKFKHQKGKFEFEAMLNTVKPFMQTSAYQQNDLSVTHANLFEFYKKGDFVSIKKIKDSSLNNSFEVLKYFYESSQDVGFSYQIYFQTKNESFNESKSTLQKLPDNIEKIDIDLKSLDELKVIRFDPLNDWVVLKIENIILETVDNIFGNIGFSSNAYDESSEILIFNNDDPQIYIDLNKFHSHNLNKLTIQLKYIAMGAKAKVYFSDFFSKQMNDVFAILDINQLKDFNKKTLVDTIKKKINDEKNKYDDLLALSASKNNALEQQINDYKNQNIENAKELITKNEIISEIKLKNEILISEIEKYSKEIIDINEEKNKIIIQLKEELIEKNEEIVNKRKEIVSLTKENTISTDLLIKEKQKLENYLVELKDKNQQIESLQNEIVCFKKSYTYKLVKSFSFIFLIFRPKIVFQTLSKKRFIQKHTKIISRNKFFNTQYYLQHNPDVAKSGMNPAKHYLLHGGFEGRKPSEAFDSKFYLEQNTDVKDFGMNPLLHYILYGEKEGRRIIPDSTDVKHESASFVATETVIEAQIESKEESKDDEEIRLIRESGLVDKEYYYRNYPDIRNAQLDPVEHYYYYGWKEGRNPGRTFDTMFYLETNNDVKETGENPLLHYILYGKNEKRSTFYPIQIDESNADQYEDKQPIKIADVDSIVKTIAFYLPQFHPFKENNEWWGEGFTEWTNVSKARSQFEGHYQPRLPGAMGFYDLRLPEIMKQQAVLAKEFGIYGFCFHHYYFAGKRLMEAPVDNLLAHPEIDLPFCLCWANENWTRRWDGFENDILIAQDHSSEDDINFLNDIEKYFRDQRYIRVDNKPLFIVYKANQFPDMKATIKRWRKHWREKWKEELHIVMAMTFGEQDPLIYGFDAAVEFPPHNIGALDITNSKKTIEGFEGRIFSYADFMTKSLIPKKVNFDLYKTVFPGWDNTARRDNNASIYADGTANHYKYWLKECIRYAKKNLSPSSRFVFINAWNEWAEGAHLEPCQKYGYCYLNATARALEESTGVNGPKVSVIVPNYNHAKYLQKRLDSIYNQTYRNFEVILLDDCSTDNSKEILKNYASEHKEISKLVINNKNSGGVFHQWAKGIEHANGDLIWIAESDDFCDADFLETLVADFNDEAVMLSYSNCVFVDEKGVALDYYNFQDYVKDIDEHKWLNSYNETAHNEVNSVLGLKNTIPNVSGVLFRKPFDMELLKDTAWLSMKVAGDWMFYLHIIQGGRIAFNKHTNNYFRRYKGSTSESTYKKQVFYEEVGAVCATIASLYKVSDDLLKKNRDNFWEFYKSQVDHNHEQFNAWFNFDKVNEAAKKRLPSVMISIYGFYAGGAEIMPIRLANELKRKGIAILLQSCGASNRNEEVRKLLRNDIPVVKSSNVNEIKQVVDSFGIDIVNSHHWQFQQLHSKYADFLGVNCKHVGTLHGIIEATDSGYAISNDDLVRVNQHVQSWTYIADKNLVPFINAGINVDDENRFVKIPNGIEIKEYKKIERGELDIPDDAFVLCTISRAIKEKGWFEAIETVKLARIKSKHDIRLILIGDGPVYEKMKTEGVPDFVTLTGYVSEPIGYYAISDMGLLLSTFQSESFPLTILECISVERPFIASNIGEIKNILSDGDQMAGQVFELDDWTIPIEEVSSIIIDFAINLSKYQVAQKLCKILSKRYNLSRIANKYINLFVMSNKHL